MLNLAQVVERPFGISVFGSCIVRVEPDVASLKFAVACLEPQPKDAFRKARETAQVVRAYLAQSAVGDVGFSRLTLSQAVRFQGGGQKLIGYTARVGFHILLHDLDRMEEILSGVVDVGANEVSSVELQTTRLRELRVEARGRAVVAAREKADNYCQAAGVEVGRVIHIEDISPDVLRGASRGHVARELQPDDQGALVAFDPESVAVGAAVIVALEIRK